MSATTRFRLFALPVSTLLIVGTLATQARAEHISTPPVPTSIQVPPGNSPFMVVHAVGTQNYTCTAQGTWGPAVPDAKLYGDNGHQVGTHYAGPTWQFLDGSTARGSRIASYIDSPGAIPWLLLQVVSTTVGPDGDRFTQTTYIQRLNTTGGVAPAGGCTFGASASVPYTADYYFYRVTQGGD
jgi:uncharacterized protein DUF3455